MPGFKRWLIVCGAVVALGLCLWIGVSYAFTQQLPWQSSEGAAAVILQQATEGPATGGTAVPQTTAEPARPIAGAPAAVRAQAPTVRHGTLQEGRIHSIFMNGDMPYLIYLPPGYDDPANAQRRYPVVYLLHGAPGAYTDWTRAGGADKTADALISVGRIPPLILVMPEGQCNLLHDSEWANGDPPAAQAESYLVKEVVPFIDAHYRTLADPAQRAIGGLSTGGYAAVNITFHHPDVFGIAFSHSGNYRAPKTILGRTLFKDSASEAYNSPLSYIRQLKEPQKLHIYLDVGKDDNADNTNVETHEMEQALTAAGIPHEVHYFEGKHSWGYWALHLADALGYVGASLPSSEPSAPTAATSPSTVRQVELSSAILGGRRSLNLYLPAGYDDPANAQRRYAVLYLLHGAPGGFRDWTDTDGLQATADRLIADGSLSPILIVMPDGNFGELGDSQWVNGDTSAGFGRVEDYVIDEVVPFIDAHERTLPDREHRAIGGLSAGAYGALNIALHHLDMFSITALHSGFYRAQPTDGGVDMFAGDRQAQRANSPVDNLDDIATIRRLAIYFDVGADDPWFVDDAKELDEALTARGIPHEFHVYAGAHSWEYWSAHLADAFRFVGAHLPRDR